MLPILSSKAQSTLCTNSKRACVSGGPAIPFSRYGLCANHSGASLNLLTRLKSRSQTVFRHMGKIGLVNGLFRSCSLYQNVGGPIRLLCKSDVLRRNNATKKAEQSRQYAGD